MDVVAAAIGAADLVQVLVEPDELFKALVAIFAIKCKQRHGYAFRRAATRSNFASASAAIAARSGCSTTLNIASGSIRETCT